MAADGRRPKPSPSSSRRHSPAPRPDRRKGPAPGGCARRKNHARPQCASGIAEAIGWPAARTLLRLFREIRPKPCRAICDTCAAPPETFDATRAGDEGRSPAPCIAATASVFGAGHLVDILTGTPHRQVRGPGTSHLCRPSGGAGQSTAPAWQDLFRQMKWARDLTQADAERRRWRRAAWTEAARPVLRGEADIPPCAAPVAVRCAPSRRGACASSPRRAQPAALGPSPPSRPRRGPSGCRGGLCGLSDRTADRRSPSAGPAEPRRNGRESIAGGRREESSTAMASTFWRWSGPGGGSRRRTPPERGSRAIPPRRSSTGCRKPPGNSHAVRTGCRNRSPARRRFSRASPP